VPRTAVLPHTTRIEPTATDHDLIATLDNDVPHSRLVMRGPDGSDVELPDSLAHLVRAAAHALALGNTVLAMPLETRLSPNEAAELLGISRPFLLRLIDEGQLAAVHLPNSRHRYLRLADVLEFQSRREATEHIADIIEQYDLPY
jgi:excisionase family DNA binding protein